MKQLFHKILSIIMVFVVLFSTLSFTVNMHYCGDTLVETALFHKAKGCGMDMQNLSSEGCAITKKNCCNDKQLVIDGQDELRLQVGTISFEQQVFVTTLGHTFSKLFEDFDKNASSYKEYKPPLVIRLLYKLDETYLI